MELNAEQQKAVTAGEGPVLISAGPGTGKTKTLTARILYLLQTKAAKPHEILALTFTKKAAQEMAERVAIKGPVICTFHALCSHLLGGDKQFVTESERLAIIKKLPKPKSFKKATARELSLRVSRAKNQAEAGKDIQAFAAAYTAVLQGRGLLDFDDLLLLARDSLQSHPERKPAYRYILVDEFQDTNTLQYDLLQLLRCNDNIFVIGDPNQSVYAFRGADGNIFDRFRRDFPDHTAINLTVNYRSAGPVVRLANAIFASSPQLTPVSLAPGGVRAFELLNEYSEAQWITGQIQQWIGGADLLGATSHEARASLRDFAILYRGRHVAGPIQKYIADSGLPYQIVGEGSPYEHPDVQNLMALMRCVAGAEVAVAGFTPAQVTALVRQIDARMPPTDVAYRLAEVFGLPMKADIKQVAGMLVRFTTVQQAVSYFDDLATNQFYDPAAETITLLTIHASKGLEFAHVFLLAAEDGVLPGAAGNLDEERRLFYVAATRAKQFLDITHVTRRAGKTAVISPFITRISPSVLPRQQDPNMTADLRRLQKRRAKQAQTSLF